MNFESNYADLLTKAVAQPLRQTRNAKTSGFFGGVLEVGMLEFNYFPVLLGRKMFWKGVVGEMAAFLEGPKNIEDFKKHGCNYWDDWGDSLGNLDIDYGNAWINFNGANQLRNVVESLKNDPFGRRHLISAWRPDRLKDLSLPCCHYSYQWYVAPDGYLEMIWNQRSTDLAIGLPSDIVLAALFNILMAQTVGLKPGKITMVLGDCHVYESHLEGVAEYLSRDFLAYTDQLPAEWTLDREATVFNFKPGMFQLLDYQPQEAIKFKLEV